MNNNDDDDSELSVLKKEIANILRERISVEPEATLHENEEYYLASGLIAVLLEFKSRILKIAPTVRINSNNKIAWTSEIEEIVSWLSQCLANIFYVIDSFSPENNSAFWSGKAVVRAENFGICCSKTPAGYVMNKAIPIIQNVLFSGETQDILKLMFSTLIWSAISDLYAHGTTSNAHVFILDGVSDCHSIFWNVELPILRQKQWSFKICQIYLHTLTPEAYQQFKLLEKENNNKNIKPDIRAANCAQINALLLDEENWISSALDESPNYKVGALNTISFKLLKKYAAHFHSSNSLNGIKRRKPLNQQNLNNVAKKIINEIGSSCNQLEGVVMIIINPQDVHQEISLLFNKAKKYRKITPVLARYVREDEIQTKLITYIPSEKSPTGYEIETETTLLPNMVIVRNVDAMFDIKGIQLKNAEGTDIHNEYAMTIEDFSERYANATFLSKDFGRLFYKKTVIEAIDIDEHFLNTLQNFAKNTQKEPSKIYIQTSWGIEMLELGGLYVKEGYAISKQYRDSYVEIASANKETFFYPGKKENAKIDVQSEAEQRPDEFSCNP
ncbi:hypothetical protein [Legionella clemsonensis]|uniref:Uncharacterized protein n=1 Tax=Legionella clemsonensis TaxID=1867846 RepID=A0A222P2W8_9GAMM|nr:hypothetical protein [Legionella clemsonensis]ASQ46182.1 hypothetical protein clem_08150 [Legionella clemsonensis]